MKVGVYLVSKNPPVLGGGFSYQERLIEAIDGFDFAPGVEVCFVGRIPSGKIKLRKKYHKLSSFSFYRLFILLDKFGFIRLLTRVTGINWDLANGADISALKENKVDVILYPKQSHAEVEGFPFISMNWDIGHRSSYAFPEFILEGNLEFRERWYNYDLKKAFAVFAESEHGKRELIEFCGLAAFKIFVVPMFPGRVVDLNVSESSQLEILSQHALSRQAYFYYPAQYWAHKNHYNLLLAFKKLKENNPSRELKLVFSGADYGNKNYIASVVSDLKLSADVVMLGFVSNEAVYTFYRNSLALVMPSLLGPTNMPLLEAQALETAVICTDFAGHREQCGEGAWYVDPQNPQTIFEAMMKTLQADVRSELIKKSSAERSRSIFTIQHATARINAAFVELARVRQVYR